MKADPIAKLGIGAEVPDCGVRRMPQVTRPRMPTGTVAFGERAERRRTVRALTLIAKRSCRTRGLDVLSRAPRCARVHHLEPEHGVPIDGPIAVQCASARRDGRQTWRSASALDFLDMEVERIAKAPTGWKVRLGCCGRIGVAAARGLMSAIPAPDVAAHRPRVRRSARSPNPQLRRERAA